jgi:hypothetical protein
MFALMLRAEVMRYLLTTLGVVLAFDVVLAGVSVAAASPIPAANVSKPAIHLTVWKNEFNSEASDHGSTDLPSLLSPVDSSSSQLDRSAVDTQQNIPVEAVPAPTAVASGMLVLAGLAAVRIFRKLRYA